MAPLEEWSSSGRSPFLVCASSAAGGLTSHNHRLGRALVRHSKTLARKRKLLSFLCAAFLFLNPLRLVS